MIRDQSLFHGPIWRPWLRRLAAAALVFATAPVLAHHSAAFFDLSKPVTLHGTVKELQWTNPHCFIQLLVPEEGKVVEWSLEMHAPVVMYRLGWRPGAFKAGDKVMVVIHRAKDGTHAGFVVSAIDASGSTLRATPLR